MRYYFWVIGNEISIELKLIFKFYSTLKPFCNDKASHETEWKDEDS